jgi:succinate dehydrogenase flavin-adding protein (antitoxin of CptAB toxin-antitoxin module)
MPITEVELRRLRWRCRRGLLENDLVLERFLDRQAAKLDGAGLDAFNRLLDLPDPVLWDLVSGRRECDDPQLSDIVARVRAA